MNKGITIGIIALFIVSAVSPMSVGFDAGENQPVKTTPSDTGSMDSAWPMYCHDIRHSGRSPYTTVTNPYCEKWYFSAEIWEMGSPVIDNEGVIYFCPGYIYALYPNGTLKWKYEDWYGTVAHSAPAIDKNGTVYVGLAYNLVNNDDFYAFYPNGTVKWIFPVGDNVFSSPIIGNDGVIYFGAGKHFFAVYPNGTLKWKYTTDDFIWGSSPAIGDDGTVYVGSHDYHIYAFHPDNGTIKWKFKTGGWVHGSPTIGDDGTIYVGSDDEYLYAIYPNNGTMKWRLQIGAIWASPALGIDGTIYVGVFEEKFYAIYPNGNIKWTFDAGGRIWFGTSAAISADGNIYFGTTSAIGSHGSDFIALNPDGTEQWRYTQGWYESSPIIDRDGTVYVASSHDDFGCLHAFGELNPNAPNAPSINGKKEGKIKTEIDYTFSSIDPNGDDVYYFIEWGDGQAEDWIGPYGSGDEIKLNHTWAKKGVYSIRARAKDKYNSWGPWGELKVTMPKTHHWWLEWFPLLQRLLEWLLG